MLEIKIPAELRKIKAKWLKGFTLRQALFGGAGVAVSTAIGISGWGKIPFDVYFPLIMFPVIPSYFLGWWTKNDMHIEEYLSVWYRFRFLPQERPYKDTEENYFINIVNKLRACEIVHDLISKGEIDIDDLDEEDDYVF